MEFDSILFLFRFLPMFLLCYFAVPQVMKNGVLFLGSLLFYAWGEPTAVTWLFLTVVSAYLHGRGIAAFRGRRPATVFLCSSVGVQLFLFGAFRYTQLAAGTAATEALGSSLPFTMGISFFTLQALSYTIDVYRSKAEAMKNFVDFGVFISMFPLSRAGLIVKYHEMEKQLRRRSISIQKISYGMKRFVLGLAKKVLLADNMAALWLEIAAMDYGEMKLLTAWLGIAAFAFWIYFTCLGYADMAVGLGAMLGFSFPENFHFPYRSASVKEFAGRWYTTLGSWLTEYVYLPLGGKQAGKGRQLCLALLVWVLAGGWYGAEVHFLLCSLWFAFYFLLEELLLRRVLVHLPKGFGRIYTAWVVIGGWVLLAIRDFEKIAEYFKALLGANGAGTWDVYGRYLCSEYALLFLIAAASCIPFWRQAAQKLENSKTGPAMMVYRLGEKVIPSLLLFLTIAYMASEM